MPQIVTKYFQACVHQINAFIILLVQKMVYYYKLRKNNMIVVDYLLKGGK